MRQRELVLAPPVLYNATYWLDYGVDGPRFDFWQGQNVSLPHNMHSGSEAHPAFSLVGTVCSLAGSKAAGPFVYSPRFQFCPYTAIFGKNNQYYWKLLVYIKCWYPRDVSCKYCVSGTVYSAVFFIICNLLFPSQSWSSCFQLLFDVQNLWRFCPFFCYSLIRPCISFVLYAADSTILGQHHPLVLVDH